MKQLRGFEALTHARSWQSPLQCLRWITSAKLIGPNMKLKALSHDDRIGLIERFIPGSTRWWNDDGAALAHGGRMLTTVIVDRSRLRYFVGLARTFELYYVRQAR